MTSTGSGGGEAMDEAAQFLKSFSDSKQSTAEWLSMLEKRLDQDEFQLTFLPVLEDKLESSKVRLCPRNASFFEFLLIFLFAKKGSTKRFAR